MVTRPTASIALAFFFVAVAACGAAEAGPRPVIRQPAAQRLSIQSSRPSATLILRTDASSSHRLFSTTTTTRTFAVMRPARTVVWSSQESSSKGGTR